MVFDAFCKIRIGQGSNRITFIVVEKIIQFVDGELDFIKPNIVNSADHVFRFHRPVPLGKMTARSSNCSMD
jgi:hypothetical protein